MSLNNPLAAIVPFKVGEIIKDQYTLVQQIGAKIYVAIPEALYLNGDISRHVAIKFEQTMFNRPMLSIEVIVLKALA
ncbi:MAG: hypothetical protein EZS28_041615, partial [Streblomastix strix]